MDKAETPAPTRLRAWLLVIPLILLSAYFVWGISSVPFHPDESTQFYNSSDFELLFTNPLSMAWSPDRADDLHMHYRQLDAPFTRYLLGLGRWLAGKSALPVDWDWSKTWEENRLAGALPDPGLLFAGRLAITLLLPLSVCLLYLIGSNLGGAPTGVLAAGLLGLNALVLLHNRRAMAEGALTLGILFAMWTFLQANRRPWLAGLGMALAFAAKQSALALLPVGLLAVAWPPSGSEGRLRRAASGLAQYLGVFILVTLALNPLLWRSPIQASKIAWEQRQDLLQRQVADTQRLAPEHVLDSPGKRILVLVANLYLAPPAFAEVGNYQDETAPAEAAYLAIPGHNLLRNLIGAGLFMVLTLFGLATALLAIPKTGAARRKTILLLLSATLLQALILILAVPLPWQRYVMPLLPFVCLWSAYAIGGRLGKKGSRE
ncbi:MAG: phospholipid carrier-dependent glycosyltransferase [Chloroflexota bacterium]